MVERTGECLLAVLEEIYSRPMRSVNGLHGESRRQAQSVDITGRRGATASELSQALHPEQQIISQLDHDGDLPTNEPVIYSGELHHGLEEDIPIDCESEIAPSTRIIYECSGGTSHGNPGRKEGNRSVSHARQAPSGRR